MNSRTARLLRSYARHTNQPEAKVKQEWNRTPATKRGEVRAAMESGMWANELKEWRMQMGAKSGVPWISEKEAAAKLGVPYDTWRGWECMRDTPRIYVRVALKAAMRQMLSVQ